MSQLGQQSQKSAVSLRTSEKTSEKSGKTAIDRRIAGTFDAYMMSKCPID